MTNRPAKKSKQPRPAKSADPDQLEAIKKMRERLRHKEAAEATQARDLRDLRADLRGLRTAIFDLIDEELPLFQQRN